jgi:sirohydrochlorin cobaltochelatase
LRQAHPEVEIRTAPAVGEDEAVLQAIAAYCIGAVQD